MNGTDISRRDWLQRATAASVALGAGSLAATEAPETPVGPAWKTAIGLNGFESSGTKYGKRFAIWEIVDYAARAGFDGVELVQNWPQGPYPGAGEATRVGALRRFYERFGLKIFSIQTGAPGAFAPTRGAREGWIAQMRERIALARALGCDCVGMWPFGGLRGETIDKAIRHLAASFREVAKIAHDQGLVAAFEIEPPFVFNSEKHLKRILEEADDPRVKTIYDPSHFDLMNGSSGKPHEMLARIGVEHIGYVHLTDSDGTLRDGGTSKHLAVGDGHIDVQASFETLRDGGFDGWVMIDGWQIPDPYDAGTKGIEAIHRFCKKA